MIEVVERGVAVVYPDLATARANRGAGQVRQRTVWEDLPAEYIVRVGDVDLARFDAPADAAVFARQHPGAGVHLAARAR